MKYVSNYNFVGNFKISNLSSLFLVLASLILIFFKGLNFGIDFKGGTLIELRVDSKIIGIADIRSSFSNINFGRFKFERIWKRR